MDRSRQSIDLMRVSGTLAVQRNLMPSQVWVGGESDFLGEACSAVEERHCQAHWILHASGANNNVCFVFWANCFKVRQKLQTDKFDFDRFKRRHVLLRVSYFGWDYMGFATQVLCPTRNITVDIVNMRSLRPWLTRDFRRMLASRLSQNCLQRCSRLSLSKAEKSQITTGND